MKRLTGYLKEKRGMTLVETLTALTILALIIFCFAPLYLSYFNTIKISGNKLKATYTEAGKLQSLIGGKGTGANSGYESNVSSIPLVFNSPETVVTQGSVTQTVHQTSVAVKTAANPNGKIDPIGGSFIFSNPTDIKAGFSTIYTNSINSNIKCFPTSLTDDFVKAYITIVADGFNFSNDNMNDLNAYSLYCTKANSANNGSELKQLVFNKDYTLERVSGTQNILLLTLYGGTDVSYENSPLVFNYNNGAYTKEIEVDAPTMIMVGEKATDDQYYYYVSRGETDDDGNLIILRRTMNSKDPKTGKNVTLTSAMNDVEWVPAESGDGRNKDSDDEKYGYYVMCGDNGQIRRFWRNNATGNYYWGGDYTYKTDIKIDKVNLGSYINGTNSYGTDVSYKFSFRANAGSSGFNLATNKIGTNKFNYLQSVNIWSITAFGDNTNGRVSAFWGSDGRMFYYQSNTGGLLPPAYSVIKDGSYQANSGDRMVNGQQSQTWLNGSKDNYYELTGADTNENPITLTSVDAIVLSGYSVGAGDGYYYNVRDNAHSYYFTNKDGWDCTTNMEYPTSSYTLYCGYIPASMDMWTTKSSPNGSFSDSMAKTNDDGSKSSITTSKLDRVSNSIDDTAAYPKWKGTLGITPYLTRANILTGKYTLEATSSGLRVYYKYNWNWGQKYEYLNYYPYENLDYALTGKFYDGSIFEKDNKEKLLSVVAKNTSKLVPTANLSYSAINGKQQYMTNGKVVDITMAYLSHPYAIHAGANPTDDVVYDLSNSKDGNKIYYWNNMRETITFLDCASTVIPNGDVDIPVSLMVGYVMGGTAEFNGDNVYVNTIMNNGIVFLRAGSAFHGTQSSANSKTEEYYAKDNTGYKLNSESNVFHQFYYLNSITTDSTQPNYDGSYKHIGDLYGAHCWQNNRHIDYISMDGGEPDSTAEKDSGNVNYLRCHPMSNTKVNCVAWGTTWNNNPEAMWGTENGTVLSWFVDLKKAKDGSVDDWGDKSVDAELQSYKWIDNVNGKTMAVGGYSSIGLGLFKGTVGSAVEGSGSAQGTVFSPSNDSYNEFFDKGSRQIKISWKEVGKTFNYINLHSSIGVISVLDSINDVAYDNDVWVAGGDQSGKAPETYCGQGSVTYGGENITAFTSRGNGSWIYVRYWVDVQGDGTQSDLNSNYFWKAVKISNEAYHNIVQVNNINGMWIATGYIDSNHNGEQDDGERTVVSWATDPLVDVDGHKNHNDSTKYAGGWSDKAVFLEYNGNGGYDNVTSTVGGINSVATRS